MTRMLVDLYTLYSVIGLYHKYTILQHEVNRIVKYTSRGFAVSVAVGAQREACERVAAMGVACHPHYVERLWHGEATT